MTATMPVILLAWKPMRRGGLLGFARIRLGRAMIVNDVSVAHSNGKAWAAMPSKPRLDANGAAMRDARGKILYTPLIEWDDKDTRDKFSISVIQAVEAQHPGATGPYAADQAGSA